MKLAKSWFMLPVHLSPARLFASGTWLVAAVFLSAAPSLAQGTQKKAVKAEVKSESKSESKSEGEAPASLMTPRGPTRIDFDDRLVQGQTNKLGAVYLYQRKSPAQPSLLARRHTFRAEIARDLLE